MTKKMILKTIEQNDILLKEARKSGKVKIENNIITGIDKTVFEI